MERKLTAILCADVHGYSRLMEEDEEATFRTLSPHRKIVDELIEQHHGRFVGSAGDSVLAEFASVVNAVQCAVDIQARLKKENVSIPPGRRMEFRIGVNLGDVIVDGEQLYGDGINVAARLESLAEPGGICISRTVHENIRNKLPFNFENIGERAVKNIAEPVQVWRVVINGDTSARWVARRLSRRYWHAGVFSFAALAIVAVTFVIAQHLSLRPQPTHAPVRSRQRPALPLPSIPSIAVLPFTNLSGDPQQVYFSDGIANQLIDDLSRLPDLFVIARNSSFAYKGRPVKEHEVGRELGVKYVLEGSVRKATNRVRIGVELVDASSGTEMWTQRFDGPLKDIFAVQDEIVGKVVTTLSLLVKLNEMNLPHGGNMRLSTNLEAFDDYLHALEYVYRMTKDDNAKARFWAESAIQLDPKFSAAHSLLGWTYFDAAWFQWGLNPQTELAHSRELALRALALDDSNVGALALITELDWMQGQFDEGVADGQRAVAINPNFAEGYLALSDALANNIKPEEALRAAERAMRLDPASQDYYRYAVADAYVQMGRYQEAIDVLKPHLALYPNNLTAHGMMIIAYVELGRDQEARAEAADVMRISPHFTLASLHGLDRSLI